MEILVSLIGAALVPIGAFSFILSIFSHNKIKHSLSASIGVISILLGLTSPIVAVSFLGLRSYDSDIAIGHVIGFVILSILITLGLASFIRPISIKSPIARRHLVFLFALSGLLLIFSRDLILDFREGSLLFASGLIYFYFTVQFTNRNSANKDVKKLLQNFYIISPHSLLPKISLSFILLVIWLGFTLLGPYLYLSGISNFSNSLKISPFVMGVTIFPLISAAGLIIFSLFLFSRDESDAALEILFGSSLVSFTIILGGLTFIHTEELAIPEIARNLFVPAGFMVVLLCLPLLSPHYQLSLAGRTLFLGFVFILLAYPIVQAAFPESLDRYTTGGTFGVFFAMFVFASDALRSIMGE